MDTQEHNQLLDFDHIHRLEYVEANGLGGYASGTFSGAHSRKYHGLLVAALKPPVQRVVVVSKLEETLFIDDEFYELGCNQFPGTLHPFGVQYLSSFSRDLFPEWTFKVKGVTIRKTIAALHGENTTLVIYEVLDAPARFTLYLQPFYNARDFHHLGHANDGIGHPYIFDEGTLRTMNYLGGQEFFISVPRSHFVEGRTWYYNFEYQQEYLRGMDFREDLYTHGKLAVTLRKGSRLGVIVSLNDPSGRDAMKLFREERHRREHVVADFNFHPALRKLALAADQFIVKRDDLNTIIAGYPWFADWGRDTMIALPGLCLVNGRYKDAKRILQKFSEYISEGMLPNRFPDSGEDPEYNTIDATLWFFNALYKYYIYSADKLFIKAILPLLRDIIEWHYKGTRYNIHVDPEDSLVYGGVDGVQLTWMDAKIGDWVVTPRKGKAVEINALWYNALCILNFLLTELDYLPDADIYQQKAATVRKSFNEVFWNTKTAALFDYVDGNTRCEDIRPNQVYAIGLPFPVLLEDKSAAVMETVQHHLLTPRGLRSLSPKHSQYKGTYQGNPWERDSSYHQGPAWSHLLGIYVDAMFNTYGDEAREASAAVVQQMFDHLNEAGLGTISELFDGDAPHKPGGCISQAWSVAEILRVSIERGLWQPEKKSSRAYASA